MNNNPFSKFEIDHLSPSAINTFIADPCIYILRYLYKHKGPSNPAMWRGTVVDEGIGKRLGFKKVKGKWVKGKTKTTKANTIKFAEKQFDGLHRYHKTKIDVDTDRAEREKAFVPKYLEVAMPYYDSLGQPDSYQKKINLQLDEIPIPIIGYIDLQYDGIVRDIKTVSRLPSEIPSGVNRQLSVYAMAEDSMPVVDYVYVTKTRAEVITMPVTDIDFHIATVKKVAHTIMNLLSYSDDINQIANLYFPDFDDWRWSPEDIAVAETIWRVK